MKINHCTFPEGLFYDTENFVWANVNTGNIVTVGITAILASIAGRLSAIKLKPVGTELEKGKSVGMLESIRYFGVVRTPVSGRIVEINESIINRPKLANDFPYKEGWFVKIEASRIKAELNALETIEDCHYGSKPLGRLHRPYRNFYYITSFMILFDRQRAKPVKK